MPPKGKGKGKAPKSHKLAATLPEKELLTDLKKQTWRIGKAIGSGGFGLIYLADEGTKAEVKSDSQYVIKIEPEANGPLFCELAFYNRAAKSVQIDEWRKSQKLKFVGVPKYIAQGRHETNGETLRFMVMPRFGADLHNLWIKAGKMFKRATVAQIAIQMIDALEYIHNKEYTHADIKGSNILCDHKDPNKLFLVDYGLATKFSNDKEHKAYKADPKKAHNGTIEYTSCDAHMGASPSRRGDFEILGFCLLHWTAGRLPWEANLGNPSYVKEEKIKSMKDVKVFVETTCPSKAPEEIIEFLQYVSGLKYEEEPNYNKTRNMFKKALASLGANPSSSIDFGAPGEQNSRPLSKLSKIPAAKASKPLQSKTNTSFSDQEDVKTANSSKRPLVKGKKVRAATKRRSSSFSECDQSKSHVPMKKAKRQARAKKASFESDDSVSDFSDLGKIPKKTTQKVDKPQRKMKLGQSKTDTSSSDEYSPKTESSSAKAPPKNNKTRRAVKRKSSSLSKSSISDEETPQKQRKKVSTPSGQRMITRSSTSANSDEINIIDSDSPGHGKSLRLKAKTSRHSMAPLHTEAVLGRNDKLTGKYKGKHPVIERRRKVNVPKANATTQTTPSLKKTQSKK